MLTTFDSCIKKPFDNLSLCMAAGFEARNCAILTRLEALGIKPATIIMIDYGYPIVNEPRRTELVEQAQRLTKNIFIFNHSKIDAMYKYIEGTYHLIDITGMTRMLIFQCLHNLDQRNITYKIAYTEAEEYFPLKQTYEMLSQTKGGIEEIFMAYLDKERAEEVYSFDCDIVIPPHFEGNPEPSKPSFLLSFVTFKRSRLQVLLQEYEFEKKFLIIAEPIREDLKWRKEYLQIANYDIIQKNAPNIVILGTLDPCDTFSLFEAQVYENLSYRDYNIYLSPLGGKMQTVGCYYFWRKHQDVSVIFSQPRQYFIESYSKGFRDSFCFYFNGECL